MSEKKKSATETTEKVMTKYDKKVQKRKEAERKAQIEKKRNRVISIVVAIAVVAFIAYFPISKYVATHSTYMKAGEHKVTQVEFDYYYQMGVANYVSQYSYLLSYMGLDTTKDFADQKYSEYTTWDDYFQQNAVNNLLQTKALYDQAKANGFEYDTSAETEAYMEMLKETAADQSMSVSDYVKSNFGKYATLKNLKPIIEESFYASAYYEQVADSKAATDEEITSYYEENVDSYDSVDFKLVEVAAEIPEGETTTDADGNTTTADPTEEQIAAAMETAKAQADEKLAVVDTEGELKENLKKSGINSLYRDWLFDAERKAGDTTVVEDSTNHKYFVLQFENRYLDDTKTVNVRVIMTTDDKGSDIVDEWNNTGANEDAFIALVEKYSEDTYTNEKGGLYEELQASSLSEELSTWMMDESRQAGDVTSVTATDGYTYVMYYVSQGRPEWKASIAGTLLNETMTDYMAEITEALEVVDTRGKLTYIEAIEAEKAAAAESETAENAN